MIPILYSETETEFETNGIGCLTDITSISVKRKVNGYDELQFQYPSTGIHFSEIVDRAIVLAVPGPTKRAQPYRIYRRTTPSKGLVTVYARHIAYDATGIPVVPFAASNVIDAMNGLKKNAAVSVPFNLGTNKATEAAYNQTVPMSLWDCLGGVSGSILDVYGGEYDFDRWDITLRNRLGEDNGVSIRYGKNLTTLEQDQNCANVATGIMPYWTDGEQTVMLSEKVVSAPGTYSFTRVLTKDFTPDFQAAPTEEQLRARTEAYIKANDIGVPTVSLKIQFVNLDQMDEYQDLRFLERVELGDSANVYFEKLNVDSDARVTETDYDPIRGRYNNINVGSVRASIASTIVQQGDAIKELPSKTQMELAVENATNWITNGKGYMVAVKDSDGNWREICSLDTPDIATAVNVWRWNNGGFGFSSNGYNGPYNIAITQDGKIVADFITTGTLNAAQVKVINLVADSIVSGKLTSKDGSVTIDLDNNTISATGVFKTIKTLYCGWQMQAVMAGYSFYLNGTDADGKTKSFVSLEADTRAGVGYFRNTATTNQGVVALIPSRVDGEPTTVQARTAAGTTEDGHILAELQSDDTMAALRLRRGTIRELLIKVDSDGWYMDGHKMKWGYVESLGGYVLMGS